MHESTGGIEEGRKKSAKGTVVGHFHHYFVVVYRVCLCTGDHTGISYTFLHSRTCESAFSIYVNV